MAADDLATVAGVKAYLNISTDQNLDNLFGRLVTAASAYFRMQTSRRNLGVPATVAETRGNFMGQRRLFTREYPITAVASVTVNGIVIPASPDFNTAGFTFDDFSIILRGGYRFEQGDANIVLSYTAGYAVGSDEATAIAQAIVELVAQKYKRTAHIDQISQSLGGQITASFSQKDVPAEVQTVIDRFSRVQAAA